MVFVAMSPQYRIVLFGFEVTRMNANAAHLATQRWGSSIGVNPFRDIPEVFTITAGDGEFTRNPLTASIEL